MAEEEVFEDWDATFLDQVIQVVELASASTQQPPQPQPQSPPRPPQQPPPLSRFGASNDYISYSPPRELSQRPTDFISKKPRHQSSSIGVGAGVSVSVSIPSNEDEVVQLKRELGRVSKQLSHLEQECLELRKERDKKEEQLNSVFSQVEAKDSKVHCLKSTHSGRDHGALPEQPVILPTRNVNTSNEQVGSRPDIAASTYRGIGVQTEKHGDSSHLIGYRDVSPRHDLSDKLLTIWSSPSGQRSGRDLVSKLFVTCSTDFQVLFGCLNLNVDSRVITKTLESMNLHDFVLQDHFQSGHSSEASKVSHLYTMLSKISSGMVQLEALFEALLDVCNLDNVVIAYRSLRILHVILDHLLSLESSSERRSNYLAVLAFRSLVSSNVQHRLSICTILRDNVIVEGLCSGNNVVDLHGSGSDKFGGLFVSSNKKSYSGPTPLGSRLFDSEILHEKEFCSYGTAMSVSSIDWVSLFQLMHQISIRTANECVKYEAASIMTVIFLKSSAHLDREKFEETLVFESVSQLLRKEAGVRVQKQAVQLFYLLLNCPKLLVSFCSGCKEAESADASSNNAIVAPAFRVFSSILQGLADCVASCGNSLQDLKLRRNAIIVLAFLASSGNAGFEILLSHKLSKTTDFLVLVLRLLVSEMNLEAAESTKQQSFKERTLLIREALIFLNRLVSNPAYSNPVLRVLTNSRDVASLTVDIANRLSRNGQGVWQSDSMIKQMRESEIVDLGRSFRKRVFTYLGDKH